MNQPKPFSIPKHVVWEAYLQVKRSKGGPGYDNVRMEDFEGDLKNNLYKIWNRMSSGTYFPPPVLQFEIPKANGGTRKLGIPTIADRIAQAAVRKGLEAIVDPQFHEDSYGYRPGKSAHQALSRARTRCWRDDWVLDIDIKSFFDSIDHDLMLRAVRKFTTCQWTILYIERWLKADVINRDGEIQKRCVGTPQGGVISPLLSNIFLHLVFDKWMLENYPHVHFERFADDIVIHFRSRRQLEMIRKLLENRFRTCKLQLSKEKTKVVYCKDSSRNETWEGPIGFDFLGYTFRPRLVRTKKDEFFVSFSPAISGKASKVIRTSVKRGWSLKSKTELSLQEIASRFNPMIRGWINYYGYFHRSSLYSGVFDYINKTLIRWAMQKYKHLRRRPKLAGDWLKREQKTSPNLFCHWSFGNQKLVD